MKTKILAIANDNGSNSKLRKTKEILKNKKGEGYIDVVITIMVLLMVLVLTMNIYSIMIVKQNLDTISEQLITIASAQGSFGADFENRVEELQEEFFNFEVTTGIVENGEGTGWYNEDAGEVNYGTTMYVTVSGYTTLKGAGVFEIPVHATSTRSSVSAIHWWDDTEEESPDDDWEEEEFGDEDDDIGGGFGGGDDFGLGDD